MKKEGLGFWGSGLVRTGWREGTAVSEEAAVDGGAVLVGVAVAVAVVEILLVGFLRGHFLDGEIA